MTKTSRKWIIVASILAVVCTISLIFVIIGTGPKKNNTLDIGKFTATKIQQENIGHGYWQVSGSIKNLTNETIEVRLTVHVKNSFGYNKDETIDLVFDPGESKSIEIDTIEAFANSIQKITLEFNDKNVKVPLKGGGDAFDKVSGLFFIFPVLVFAVIIAFIVCAIVTNSTKYIRGKISNIDSQIKQVSDSAEIDRLNNQKSELQDELKTRYVTCEYCHSKNLCTETKCSNCGASIK